MQIVSQIYLLSKQLPKDEIYVLTPHIRRTSISVPSNIAEGYGRSSTNDYIRFLHIANGSLYELQTQLEICFNLKYISKNAFEELYEPCREVERLLSSLIRKLCIKKLKQIK